MEPRARASSSRQRFSSRPLPRLHLNASGRRHLLAGVSVVAAAFATLAQARPKFTPVQLCERMLNREALEFRFWHFSDIRPVSMNVRYRG
jgi:hypothetical protein